MALTAQFVDGKLLTQSQQNAAKSAETGKNGKVAEKGNGGEMDKDAFLQLLVAQMKYQDPLEPTSNTEYVSQYATFSELEQMQNMSSSLNLSRASETVGKEVIVESKTEGGETKTVQGYVEKVVYNGSKAYLSIDGALYSIDDLKQVIDSEYLAGSNSVEKIQEILGKLPKLEVLSMNEVGDVVEAYNLYGNLTEYQLSLLPKDTEETLKQYVAKANELMAAALTTDSENENTNTDNAESNEELITEGQPTEEL